MRQQYSLRVGLGVVERIVWKQARLISQSTKGGYRASTTVYSLFALWVKCCGVVETEMSPLPPPRPPITHTVKSSCRASLPHYVYCTVWKIYIYRYYTATLPVHRARSPPPRARPTLWSGRLWPAQGSVPLSTAERSGCAHCLADTATNARRACELCSPPPHRTQWTVFAVAYSLNLPVTGR